MGISDDIKPRKYRRIVERARDKEKIRLDTTDGQLFSRSQSKDEDFFDGTPIKNNHLSNAKRGRSKSEHKQGTFSWLYSVVIAAVIIILLALIVWQNYPTIKGFLNGSNKENNAQTLNDIINSSTTSESSKNIDAGNSTSQDAQPTPTEETTNKSAISISVLNGSGVKLAANSLASILTADGFTIKYTGNAKSFSYQSTIVYFKTGKESEADLVKSTLESKYQVSNENNDVITGSLYDIVVVAGKK